MNRPTALLSGFSARRFMPFALLAASCVALLAGRMVAAEPVGSQERGPPNHQEHHGAHGPRASDAASAGQRDQRPLDDQLPEDARPAQGVLQPGGRRRLHGPIATSWTTWRCSGDTSFAYRVFNKFLERIDERVKLVDELVPLSRRTSRSTRIWTPIPITIVLRQERRRNARSLAQAGQIRTARPGQSKRSSKARRRRTRSPSATTTWPSGCGRPTTTSCWKCI